MQLSTLGSLFLSSAVILQLRIIQQSNSKLSFDFWVHIIQKSIYLCIKKDISAKKIFASPIQYILSGDYLEIMGVLSPKILCYKHSVTFM